MTARSIVGWTRGDVVAINDPAHPQAVCVLTSNALVNEPRTWLLIDGTCAQWRSTEWVGQVATAARPRGAGGMSAGVPTSGDVRDEHGDYCEPWGTLYNAHEADDFDGQMVPAIKALMSECEAAGVEQGVDSTWHLMQLRDSWERAACARALREAAAEVRTEARYVMEMSARGKTLDLLDRLLVVERVLLDRADLATASSLEVGD